MKAYIHHCWPIRCSYARLRGGTWVNFCFSQNASNSTFYIVFLHPTLQGGLNEGLRRALLPKPTCHIRVKGREQCEFLHRPIRVKKYGLQHFVQPTLRGGLNEGVRTPLLAHPMLLCKVNERGLGKFLLRPKRVKNHVLHRFVHATLQGGLNKGLPRAMLPQTTCNIRVKGRD